MAVNEYKVINPLKLVIKIIQILKICLTEIKYLY